MLDGVFSIFFNLLVNRSRPDLLVVEVIVILSVFDVHPTLLFLQGLDSLFDHVLQGQA